MKKISLKNILKKTFKKKTKKIEKKTPKKVKKNSISKIKKNSPKKSKKILEIKQTKNKTKSSEANTENLRISKTNELKPEIKKVKKQETEKRSYKIKDYIVYPKHEVGQITEFKKYFKENIKKKNKKDRKENTKKSQKK